MQPSNLRCGVKIFGAFSVLMQCAQETEADGEFVTLAIPVITGIGGARADQRKRLFNRFRAVLLRQQGDVAFERGRIEPLSFQNFLDEIGNAGGHGRDRD